MIGRQIGAGPAQRRGAILGAHGVDGHVAGEVWRALLKLQLTAFAGKAAEREAQEA